jgi:hypothetical protein
MLACIVDMIFFVSLLAGKSNVSRFADPRILLSVFSRLRSSGYASELDSEVYS